MRRLTRRSVLRGCAGIPAALSLLRPVRAAQETGSTGTPADFVRFAWWSDVGAPTPFQVSTTGPGGAVLLTLLYDTLTWKDTAGIIPWLAAAWTIGNGGRDYTFQLVGEAAWQDGR